MFKCKHEVIQTGDSKLTYCCDNDIVKIDGVCIKCRCRVMYYENINPRESRHIHNLTNIIEELKNDQRKITKS